MLNHEKAAGNFQRPKPNDYFWELIKTEFGIKYSLQTESTTKFSYVQFREFSSEIYLYTLKKLLWVLR